MKALFFAFAIFIAGCATVDPAQVKLDVEPARYMLVTCSAFVNYLISRYAAIGYVTQLTERLRA